MGVNPFKMEALAQLPYCSAEQLAANCLRLILAPDGTIYRIEFLNARKQIKRGKRNRFKLRNNSTGKDVGVELPFLGI